MKLNVHDILPDKPRHIVLAGTEPFLREILANLSADDGDTDRSGDRISADITISREGKDLFVEGTAHVTLHPPCARCLKIVTLELDPVLAVSLVPGPRTKPLDEKALAVAAAKAARAPAAADKKKKKVVDDEDEEASTYHDDEIDVGLVLNEQLLLEMPFKVLCDEDCEGLCATCGANLNEGPCACAPQPKSLAFAELKNIKPQN